MMAPNFHNPLFAAALLAVSALAPDAAAQACAKPADGDWQKTVLVDANSPVKLDKPVAMSILPDGRVFLCEMWSGKIKLFSPASGVSDAGSVAIYSDGVENGLLGIAADPDFAANNWVYVFFARKLPGAAYSAGDANTSPHEHVLARMTFSGGKLGNLKDILTFKRLTKRHAGGGITVNPATGEIFIPTGDDVYPLTEATYWGGRNEANAHLNDLGTAANSNDLRGKVLRIKPIPFSDGATPVPGIGSTYSIPAGNLFPIGMAKTRPEIYTMGHRNAYKVKVDPVSGASLLGEVGPDAGGPQPDRGPTGSDEFNLATGPGFYGWPFAIADNQPYVAYDGEAYPKGTTFDVKALKNKSKFNTGIEDLPPAIGALAYYNARNSQTGPNTVFGADGESAISGPYYRYEAGKPGIKMPAYFHGKFIVGDWSRSKVWSLELADNKSLKKVEFLWNVIKVIDLAIGPEGDLYVLTLGTGTSYEGDPNTGNLFRMQYKGGQYAATSCPHYVLPTGVTGMQAARDQAGGGHPRLLVNLASRATLRAPAGASAAVLYDLKGGRKWEGQVLNGMVSLPGSLSSDLGFLLFK
jgi:cytochrome c